MGGDLPDGTKRIIVTTVVVGTTPVVPAAATERAAGGKGNYTGTLQAYQTVVSWTVATGKVGELSEILVYSNQWAKTSWQITIGDVTWATGWVMQISMPLLFFNLKLAAGTVVTVSAKSTDGTSITADATIDGKEIG